MTKKRKKNNYSKTSSNRSSGNMTKEIASNLVELQKVHANLAEKFDNLAKQISSLLNLFEMAARSLSKHPAIQSSEKDREFLDKIDKLLEQNKTIAKGLTLMEGKVKERLQYSPPSFSEEKIASTPSGRPLPKF